MKFNQNSDMHNISGADVFSGQAERGYLVQLDICPFLSESNLYNSGRYLSCALGSQ